MNVLKPLLLAIACGSATSFEKPLENCLKRKADCTKVGKEYESNENYKEATIAYEEATKADSKSKSTLAQERLGWLHMSGLAYNKETHSLEQDTEQGLALLESAAQQSGPQKKIELAHLLSRDMIQYGQPLSYEKATHWYNKAKEEGSTEAQGYLDQLGLNTEPCNENEIEYLTKIANIYNQTAQVTPIVGEKTNDQELMEPLKTAQYFLEKCLKEQSQKINHRKKHTEL